MSLDRTATVARIAAAHPETARVFTRHGIPFCCHGNMTVGEACRTRALDADALFSALEDAIAAAGRTAPEPDLATLPDEALLGYVVQRYHAGERRALEMVVPLAGAVADEYRARNPKLDLLRSDVEEFARMLGNHLDREERSLFPVLAGATRGDPGAEAGLDRMAREHGELGLELLRVRSLADGFATPAWGCGGYRTLMSELRALEADVMAHVHVEEDVVAPRFAAPRSAAGDEPIRIGVAAAARRGADAGGRS